MEGNYLTDLAHEPICVLIKTLPIFLISLIVLFAIALTQSFTQIQGLTLSFMPRIIAMFAAIFLSLFYKDITLQNLNNEILNLTIKIK